MVMSLISTGMFMHACISERPSGMLRKVPQYSRLPYARQSSTGKTASQNAPLGWLIHREPSPTFPSLASLLAPPSPTAVVRPPAGEFASPASISPAANDASQTQVPLSPPPGALPLSSSRWSILTKATIRTLEKKIAVQAIKRLAGLEGVQRDVEQSA